jgi:hypothetical protein
MLDELSPQRSMRGLFSGVKRLKVDSAELEDEKESLSSFLAKSLDRKVTSDGRNVLVESDKMSVQELKELVNRFIYHKHLNNDYWVTLEGSTVKIHKFKEKKAKKRKKPPVPPSTIKHGW